MTTRGRRRSRAPGLPILVLALFASGLVHGCDRSPPAPPDAELAAVRAGTLADAIASARPGDTIVLPTGTFEGGITLPARVSLRGAGCGKTTIDARKAEVGVTIDGGEGAEVADLTVWGAGRTGVLAVGGSGVVVRRVRTTGGLNGVNLDDVTGGRVENVISDDNHYGIVVSGGRRNAVINCTLVRNANIGLSFPSGEESLAFNNCIAEGAIGVYLGASAREVRLDHNLYFSLLVGKMAGQVGGKTLGDWQALSGQDAHSVQLPLTFRDAARGDFRPSGTLPWSLERAPTSDWGAAELSGVKAPESDLDGAPRAGPFDVGAYEVAPPTTTPRPADGMLTVRSDAGLKSAGVFAPGGREVAYLFHNLPLPAGKHRFWLPPRDFQGRPIAAGTYELRTAESALSWDYVHGIGDNGPAFPSGQSSAVSVRPSLSAFDGAGRLVVGQGRAGDAPNLRAYDAATGRPLWTFGGSSDVLGLAPGGEDTMLMLRRSGSDGLITRIDSGTGKVARWGDRDSGTFTFKGGSGSVGLAELDGRLYVADAKADIIRHGSSRPPVLDRTIAVPAPTNLSADASTRRLWVISGGDRLRAFDPEGKLAADIATSGEPSALAVREGRLAVASRATGLVHLLDTNDPKTLRPIGKVGTGDGPFGPYQPDRFLFQTSARRPGSAVSLALGPKGELALTDDDRLLVFDREGKCLWSTFGLDGDACVVSFADRGRVFTRDGRKSIRLDERSGTWSPEGFWDVPKGEFLGAFAIGGKTFGVFVVATDRESHGSLLVVRYDGYSARPVLALAQDAKTRRYLARKDSDGDGRIDDRDAATELSPPEGQRNPLRGGPVAHRVYNTLQPGGDVVALNLHPETWGVIWHVSGLDPQGIPIYRLEDCRELVRRKGGLVSPVTGRADDSGVLVGAIPGDDGGFTGLIRFRSSPGGSGLPDHAGTDLIGVDASGERLWNHPLSEHEGLQGLQSVGPVVLTSVAATREVLAFTRDGLGLGTLGFRSEAQGSGSSLDHPRSFQAYRGDDGKSYALVADVGRGMQHWWRLNRDDTIATSATAITVDEPAARALAALPAPPAPTSARPATPVVRVARLASDLPIDGDLAKWRKAGVAPQVIVTPESAAGAIDGPRDVSAVVRLAYHGHAIYLQVLTFDDVPSFHQPAVRLHQQDGVEFCINGFRTGFTFDITGTQDAGPIVMRRRFGSGTLDWLVPAEHAPRVVEILPDARDVPERRLIEAISGVDMADSPVIVTECKLPIDAVTYQDAVKDLFPLESGRTFRLGILIDDNDVPGTDVHDSLAWPATFGNTRPIDDGAIAVLE